MKNVILIATLLLTAFSYGQRPEKRMEVRESMTPQQEASIKSKKMALELDLTEKQQDEVYKLLVDQATNRPAKLSKEERQKMTQEARLTLTENRLQEQIDFKRDLKEVLSMEQYEQFEEMMSKRKKGAKKRMNKRKGNR